MHRGVFYPYEYTFLRFLCHGKSIQKRDKRQYFQQKSFDHQMLEIINVLLYYLTFCLQKVFNSLSSNKYILR